MHFHMQNSWPYYSLWYTVAGNTKHVTVVQYESVPMLTFTLCCTEA